MRCGTRDPRRSAWRSATVMTASTWRWRTTRRRSRPGGGAGERSAGGGARGLQGLAERAQLLGGSLQAGPRPDGGFSVRAWLPAAP
jgi:hypothetical protein